MPCNHTIRENKEYFEYKFKVENNNYVPWRISKNIPCSICRNIVCNDCFLNIFRINNGFFICPHCSRSFDLRSKYSSVDKQIKGILQFDYSS